MIVEKELRFLIPMCLELKIERNICQKLKFMLQIFLNGGHKPEVVIAVLNTFYNCGLKTNKKFLNMLFSTVSFNDTTDDDIYFLFQDVRLWTGSTFNFIVTAWYSSSEWAHGPSGRRFKPRSRQLHAIADQPVVEADLPTIDSLVLDRLCLVLHESYNDWANSARYPIQAKGKWVAGWVECTKMHNK